jgi:hypothetical protein
MVAWRRSPQAGSRLYLDVSADSWTVQHCARRGMCVDSIPPDNKRKSFAYILTLDAYAAGLDGSERY